MTTLASSRMARRLAPWAAAWLLVACNVEKLTSVLEPETGTGQVYALLTFNGKAMPAELVSGSTTLEIRKGALTLSADSSWILSYVVRQSNSGGQQSNVQSVRGEYSIAATTLRLRFTGDSTTRFSGPYSATDVTITDVTVTNGDRLTFRR